MYMLANISKIFPTDSDSDMDGLNPQASSSDDSDKENEDLADSDAAQDDANCIDDEAIESDY